MARATRAERVAKRTVTRERRLYRKWSRYRPCLSEGEKIARMEALFNTAEIDESEDRRYVLSRPDAVALGLLTADGTRTPEAERAGIGVTISAEGCVLVLVPKEGV